VKEKTLTISEAQREIIHLPKLLVAGKQRVVAVTCDGKPVLAILPYEAYKRLLETINALQDTIAMCQDEEQMATLRNTLTELRLDTEI
jgi:PHD/YefM family antitoxin component YafN of YafNO toxin-antitoxin module